MTWLEFKTAVEAAGVRDEDEIKYIDWGTRGPPTATRENADDDWAIT